MFAYHQESQGQQSVSDKAKAWANDRNVKVECLRMQVSCQGCAGGKGRSAARTGSRSRGTTMPFPPKAQPFFVKQLTAAPAVSPRTSSPEKCTVRPVKDLAPGGYVSRHQTATRFSQWRLAFRYGEGRAYLGSFLALPPSGSFTDRFIRAPPSSLYDCTTSCTYPTQC
jgi:hypothetical protein